MAGVFRLPRFSVPGTGLVVRSEGKKILGQNEEWEPRHAAPGVQPWGVRRGATGLVSADCLILPQTVLRKTQPRKILTGRRRGRVNTGGQAHSEKSGKENCETP